jgi:hypothetical protein
VHTWFKARISAIRLKKIHHMTGECRVQYQILATKGKKMGKKDKSDTKAPFINYKGYIDLSWMEIPEGLAAKQIKTYRCIANELAFLTVAAMFTTLDCHSLRIENLWKRLSILMRD